MHLVLIVTFTELMSVLVKNCVLSGLCATAPITDDTICKCIFISLKKSECH